MSWTFKCKRCGKEETLKYKAYWYRCHAGTGCCRKCANRGGNSGSFKKGLVPWNKGLLGFGKWPKWFPKREKNPAWRGGLTDEGHCIRKSKEYQLWRQSVFERDGYTCIWCGKIGGELHADHIKPFSLYPELRFAIDNGRTLCRECHKKTDTYLSGVNRFREI